MNKLMNYWNYYYKKKNKYSKPSNFAYFVKKKFINKKKNLLEIGCGDGRDSFFFSKKGLNVTALDASKEIIKKNKLRQSTKTKNINFLNLNIKQALKVRFKKFEFIYLRFFLHAINIKNQKLLFLLLKRISKKNTLIFFEFRTNNDNLINSGKKLSKYERFTDHYRRFIEVNFLKNEIIKMKIYKIIYLIERKGLSKTKSENPVLCRLVLRKKL